MKIYTHHDPDGLISAYLFAIANNLTIDDIVVTDEFGETKNWQDGYIMTDMRPDNPEIKGTVYDHHPNHPEKRNYKLIWEDVPASLIVFKQFEPSFEKKDRWKVIIGLGGDASLELTPPYLFTEYPQLLQYTKTWSGINYGKIKMSFAPNYLMLSSAINSFCRVKKYKEALKLIEQAETPRDILEDSQVIKYKSMVDDEYKKIISNMKVYSRLNGNVILAIFSSDFRMSGYIAAKLNADSMSTVIAINEKSGSVSVRGVLAEYIKYILEPYKDIIEIDGHKLAMGGKCKNVEALKNVLY